MSGRKPWRAIKRKGKRKEPKPADRLDMDERISLNGPEYEEVVKALLDTPRNGQATSDDAEGSEGDSR